jgi:hypothetical protein
VVEDAVIAGAEDLVRCKPSWQHFLGQCAKGFNCVGSTIQNASEVRSIVLQLSRGDSISLSQRQLLLAWCPVLEHLFREGMWGLQAPLIIRPFLHVLYQRCSATEYQDIPNRGESVVTAAEGTVHIVTDYVSKIDCRYDPQMTAMAFSIHTSRQQGEYFRAIPCAHALSPKLPEIETSRWTFTKSAQSSPLAITVFCLELS